MAVAVAACVLLGGGAAVPGAHAARIGVVTDLSWGGRETEAMKTISLLKADGVRTVRMNVNWRMVEPNARGVYDAAVLGQLDRTVDRLRKAGIEVLMPIENVPYWASADPGRRIVDGVRVHDGLYRPARVQDYAAFVSFVVRRYAPKGVHLYEIWNEPNHPHFWPSGPDPVAYTALLRAASRAIRAADPSARIVLGGLSGNAATYLDGLYRAGARGLFDIAGVHPYTGSVDPSWCWTLPGTAREAPDAFCGLQEVRRVMRRNGDASVRVWLTEFGWSSAAAPHGVTEARQALFLTRAAARLASYPWVERAYWYGYRNLSWGRDDPGSLEANYGLRRTDFTAKPALAALRAVLARDATSRARRMRASLARREHHRTG